MTCSNCRIIVLISGSGSNLQALIDACKANKIAGQIQAVISNRPNVKGLERAQLANIPTITLDHKGFDSRKSFDQALAAEILSYKPDLVVLAGFMRILTPEFVRKFEGKMLNIHPSLLPRHRGLHTHQAAIDAGDTEHGCSTHFVTTELDGGPVIFQARIPVNPGETAQSLADDVLIKEHIIYPLTANLFCTGRLAFEDNTVKFDGKLLENPLNPDTFQE